MGEQPPVIDVSGLCDGDAAALRRVASELAPPCRRWGIFQVVDHGIAADELDEFERVMRAFFELPDEVKQSVRRTRDNARGYYDSELTKNRPDWKEVFDYGPEGSEHLGSTDDAGHSDGVNQWPGLEAGLWPAELPELRATLMRHYASCERLALGLLRALCVSLEAPAETLDSAFDRHSSFVRLNRYVPCPDPAAADAPLFPESGHLGVYHHTDAGALTIVYQDDVAGLQSELDGRFVTMEPIRGAFVVNLADMLQVWSNDRYRSPLHRVIVNAERTRLSAPFFLNPSYEVTCAPLPQLLEQGETARYRPVSWAHFRDQRSAGDYADQGTEIQIEQFRIA